MSLLHIGMIVLKSTAKPIIETAIEYYAMKLVKSSSGDYSKHQIDSICDNGVSVDGNSYVARVKGYYSYSEMIEQLEKASSDLAVQIKEMAFKLNEEDDDFVLISHDDA